jgi:hypothetical protein
MKLNITVVATKTFIAGLEPADVAMLQGAGLLQNKPIEDSIGGGMGRWVELLFGSVSAGCRTLQREPYDPGCECNGDFSPAI